MPLKFKTEHVLTLGRKGTNALSAAARTFRETTGMLSWSHRAGSEVFNNYILANLPADLKKRNTTRGWRDIVSMLGTPFFPSFADVRVTLVES